MKINNKLWALAIPMMIMGYACSNMGYDKTKSGLLYKIFDLGKGNKLKPNDIVKFSYQISYNDSVIADSYKSLPGYDMVDSVGRKHDFSEVWKLLRVGDSLVTLQSVDTLLKENPMGMPPYMKPGGKIKTILKVLALFSSRDAAMNDYEKEIQKFKDSELSTIQKYLLRNNIKAEKFKGIYVEVKDKGTGAAVTEGKEVSILYSGSNFEGKYFDSNVDSTKQFQPHDLNPFTFIAGRQGAIQGMLAGVTAFNLGGKGRLFIPSSMAYGPQGSPPVIKGNENLIFEIEIVGVKDAPPIDSVPPPMPR